LCPIVAESSGDPLKINVNKGPRTNAASLADAVAIVRRYVAAGYSVDIGLGQINSRNLAHLGVSIEQAFEPCTNLGLASRVLQDGYAVASRHYSGLDAISATYSLYNTGSMSRFRQRLCRRVWAAAASVGSITSPPVSGAPSPSSTSPATIVVAAACPEQWVIGQTNQELRCSNECGKQHHPNARDGDA
jgi:type IV secretion system protein VirB1